MQGQIAFWAGCFCVLGNSNYALRIEKSLSVVAEADRACPSHKCQMLTLLRFAHVRRARVQCPSESFLCVDCYVKRSEVSASLVAADTGWRSKDDE